MIDYFSLFKNTDAYKILCEEKRRGALSHAYLFITPDRAALKAYLIATAKTILCESDRPCGVCRAEKLIDAEANPDVIAYPKGGGDVKTEDINSLISEAFVKPLESDYKIFIINDADTMNASAQNKLLKTLEEPPKNVIILLGAASEFPLLPTVKSRVKKLDVPRLSDEVLFNVLRSEAPDEKRLREAIAAADGTVVGVLTLYGDEEFSKISELAVQVLLSMKSSKEVLEYSSKVNSLKTDFGVFLDVLQVKLSDALKILSDEKPRGGMTREDIMAAGFNCGSVIGALESVVKAAERKKFNATTTMLADWLLMQILEAKYVWQKL